MTRMEGNTMRGSRCCWILRFVLMTLVVLSVLQLGQAAPYRKSHQRTLRLCSRSLSDALYLVCRERGGYNEPFSYSEEDEPRGYTGPGLVEECCYHSCSYEQLEQYCKPSSEEKRSGVIGEEYRIVNLPYSSARTEESGEEGPRLNTEQTGEAQN